MTRPSMSEAGLRIAIEMERRGYNLYMRAQHCTESPALIALLTGLANEEALHQQLFLDMLERLGAARVTHEENAMLAAKAADFFFPGGLMQVAMAGALASPDALLAEAMQAERDSIAFYVQLKEHLSDAERATVDTIIREEEGHLRTLAKKRETLTEE